MKKVRIIRRGATTPVTMALPAAHKLVQSGKFSYADTTPTALPRAKPKARAADEARRADARQASTQAKVQTQVQDPLEDKTKEQIVSYLRSYGQKVDLRNSKADLLKQAQRYQRRDMRAE